MQAQIEQLTNTVNKLMAAQKETAAETKAAKKQAIQADANAAQAKASVAESKRVPVKTGWGGLDAHGHAFLERKPGKSLTFYTPGGEITTYGQLDVSIDATTKDARDSGRSGHSVGATPGGMPVGNFGWMPANLDQYFVSGRPRFPADRRSAL